MRSSLCVGATGFEPATTWSQTRSATGLRYTPLCLSNQHATRQTMLSKLISELRVQRYDKYFILPNKISFICPPIYFF